MSKNKILQPKIRFKEFSGENAEAWEQRKLGELVSIKGRIGFRGYTREDIVSKDDGVLTFSPGNIDNNQIKISDNNTYITRNKYMESPEIMIENNDILFVKTGSTLGKSAIIRNFKEEATINPQIVLFKEMSINQEYLSNYLVSKYIQKQISSVRIGGAIPTLTETAIGNLIIWVPSIKKQDVIGRFFRNLDDTITLHQRKLEALENLKKTLLSNMFPKNGKAVPELRFAGFTDNWEQRKLGELAESFEYGLNSAAISFDGENKYLRITDIDDSSNLFKQNSLTSPDTNLETSDNYLLKKGDVLFARTGASVGKTYRYQETDGKVYYAGFLIRARIKLLFDSEFVFQNTLTSKYNNFIKITSQRSGQQGINAQEYRNFELYLPTLKEQQNISSFFQMIDGTITLHQRKIEQYQELKKTLLSKMFI